MSGWTEHQLEHYVRPILRDLHWLINHEVRESYQSVRAYDQPTRHQVVDLGHTFAGDCTGTPKLVICGWHGVPVFDGEPNGYGDTETFSKGPRVWHVGGGPDQWQPLDLLLYKKHSGSFRGGPGEHCTVLLERPKKIGWDWPCFSMGSTPGPNNRPANYRDDLAMVVRFPIPLK